MEAMLERLTTTEAAVAAGVSVPQINRIIDEKILPEDLYSTSAPRTFRTDAALLIAFYFETANWLTPNARLEAIRDARKRCATWDEWRDCTLGEQYLTIRFSDLWKEVDGRLRRLSEARAMVVEDPEILSGTPVIRGTRIPVHDVAAQVEAGVPMEEILEMYPLISRAQVELASIYAKAVPQRGRPRRLSIPGASVVSVTKKRLRSSSMRA
ncbi:MAG TPA: DUF433 domain-containing protein [Terracidiphilus sp.]|nr:DUF433 domain-containing protein [Terracidiphilus sp.]HEV2398553.1 DUF433 domain-containing protein [Candidatus Sulfotelmatobacter sp.]